MLQETQPHSKKSTDNGSVGSHAKTLVGLGVGK